MDATPPLPGLLDAFPERIAVLDHDGRIIAVNRAWRTSAEANGLSGAGLGTSYLEVCDRAAPIEPVARTVATALRDVLAGHRDTFETPYDFATDAYVMRILAAPEGPGRVLVVHEDVTRWARALDDASDTARRSTEALARIAKREETVAAMGALVAGVAHEVRNPLFAISSTLDAFEAELGDDVPRTAEWLHALRTEVTRMSALMSDLLDFGRPPRRQPAPLSVVDAVHAGIAASASLVRASRVRVRIEHTEGAGAVMGDERRLAQVFQQLVANAIQHSPEGGDVVVRIEETTLEDGTWLDCTVLDEGPGFRPEDLGRLFDPFFTRRRGGTGLGLAIVQRVAHDHGGEVSATTRTGGGGSVRVRLPALARPRLRRLA